MTKRVRSPESLLNKDETGFISQRSPLRKKKLRIDIPVELGCITPLPLTLALKSLSKKSVSPKAHGLAAIGVCSMGLYYAISIRKGCRRKMEDTFCALPNLTKRPDKAFFGVFDGHGREGKHAALFAASQFSEFAESEPFSPDVRKAFRTAFRRTDERCLQRIDDGGTTATCLYIDGELKKIWVANVGDSRCVLCRGGIAVNLSEDQKPDRHDEKERIEKVGGHVVFCYGSGGGIWRVEGVLNISRSIGDKRLKKFISSEPEVHEEDLNELDQFLILATDGLWNVMDSQTAVDIVKNYQYASPAEAAEALSRAALARKTTDNICVMVMFLNSPSPTPDIKLPSFLLQSDTRSPMIGAESQKQSPNSFSEKNSNSNLHSTKTELITQSPKNIRICQKIFNLSPTTLLSPRIETPLTPRGLASNSLTTDSNLH